MTTYAFDQPGVAFDQPGVSFDATSPPSPGGNRMAKVKLGLRSLTEDQVLDLVQTILTSMTGNANFPTPVPTLAEITTLRTDALTKRAAADLARAEAEQKTTLKDEAFELLKDKVALLANYVENASGGLASKIESAGMGVQSPKAPVGILPAPINLLATDGGTEGELKLRWKAVPKASSYKIQIATGEAPTNWEDLDTCTKAAYIATDLTSGTKYWFRVAAVSSAGTGGWSDPACRIAP